MVEFALAAPVLFLLVWGIIEIAHLFFVYNTVVVAAREASRYGATELHKNDCAGMRQVAKRAGAGLAGIADSDITIFYDEGPDPANAEQTLKGQFVCGLVSPSPLYPYPITYGTRVTVTVTGHYSPLVPIIEFTPLTITSASTHTILIDIPISTPEP